MGIFQPLEVVNRGSETQPQVVEILINYYNMGVSLEVILYSTAHVSPRHVLAHTFQ